jgi:hypothetical protein
MLLSSIGEIDQSDIINPNLEGWTMIRCRRGRVTRVGLGRAPAAPRLLSAQAPSRLMVSLRAYEITN